MNVAEYLVNNYKTCSKMAASISATKFDAEEILHNTYLKIIKSNAVADNPEAYIYVTMKFNASSYYKRKRLIKKWEENNLIFDTDAVCKGIEDTIISYETFNLWKLKVLCIYILANEYNKPVVHPKKVSTTLRVKQLKTSGKSATQIAKILGISRKGVIWQFSKIKREKNNGR